MSKNLTVSIPNTLLPETKGVLFAESPTLKNCNADIFFLGLHIVHVGTLRPMEIVTVNAQDVTSYMKATSTLSRAGTLINTEKKN